MASLLYRLGRFSARRRWLVIISWLIVLALSAVAFASFKGTIGDSITIPGTATSKVADELAKKFPTVNGGGGSVVFETTNGHTFTAVQKTEIKALMNRVGKVSGVISSTDPFTAQSKLTDQRHQLADGQKKLAEARAQLAAAQASGDVPQTTIDTNRKLLQQNTDKLTAGSRLLDLAKGATFVSTDGSAALGTVQFTQPGQQIAPKLQSAIMSVIHGTHVDGVHVYVSSTISEISASPFGIGEVIGFLIAVLVLWLFLGTVLGAALPLASAIMGLGVSVLAALSFSGIADFIAATPVLAVMLGLAVGIDYALFILNRHRRQLKQGMEVQESIGLANGTSGNAVVFAGSTVLVALLALNVTGIPFVGLMGTVGAASVAVAILVAITFTPALLSLVGMRILKKRERLHIGEPTRTRLPEKPMRTSRAIITLVIGVGILLAVAAPALQMRLGLPDGSSDATSSTSYKAYKAVADKFGPGNNGPLLVVANLPKKTTGTPLLEQEAAIGEKLAAQKDVSAVAPIGVSSDNTVIAFQVVPNSGPSAAATETLVRTLRDLSPVNTSRGNVTLGVAGTASANIDVSDKLASVLPLYLAVVLGISLIILILVFRSLLVPLTATIGFTLSLAATLGGLTAVYQLGWLSAVFGVHDPGPVISFLPVIEIGVLFGLAMDYQLFLVSGMREAYAHGIPARVAVQHGFRLGRTVVASAAIIMISVFSGFVFSDAALIRPIGFGLGFGVIVDAFIVRLLLIPAAMHLLGKTAWWFPRWLDRILPDIDVEGAKLERTHPILHPATMPSATESEPSTSSRHEEHTTQQLRSTP
jgi:RND superfamily putative drug exporter